MPFAIIIVPMIFPETHVPDMAARTRKYKNNVTDWLTLSILLTCVPYLRSVGNASPFWEAVDLHYWATNNYEWYDPAAVTTVNGHLRISLTQHPQNNLNFRGGMIQTWNKFCFTGGVLVARVRLPGKATVPGLWPAVWMMGNLGRAGYGATLQGTWPYSYDACDVGTMANQTDPESLHSPNTRKLGDCIFNMQYNTKSLSFLPGQRLSACTCPGDDHPGPQLPNGSYAGRMAPEIDLFEAQVSEKKEMTVSQSTQYAPFNGEYLFLCKFSVTYPSASECFSGKQTCFMATKRVLFGACFHRLSHAEVVVLTLPFPIMSVPSLLPPYGQTRIASQAHHCKYVHW